MVPFEDSYIKFPRRESFLDDKDTQVRGERLMIQKNVYNPDQANSIDSIKSENDSRPKDEEARSIIANMDAIDFQTLLAEQMNR